MYIFCVFKNKLEYVMSFYCLDFDGVLCNSIKECLLCGVNAYYNKSYRYLNEIDRQLAEFFYAHRYLVRPAEEMLLIFKGYDMGMSSISLQEFDMMKTENKNEIKQFADPFYSQRELLKKDLPFWLSLNALYPQTQSFINAKNPFYVVSNKDYDSIKVIASHFGYESLIVNIYSRELALNKRDLFSIFFEKEHVNPINQRIVFVDDQEAHLLTLTGLGIELCHADWGYNKGTDSQNIKTISDLSEIVK